MDAIGRRDKGDSQGKEELRIIWAQGCVLSTTGSGLADTSWSRCFDTSSTDGFSTVRQVTSIVTYEHKTIGRVSHALVARQASKLVQIKHSSQCDPRGISGTTLPQTIHWW